MDTTAVPGPGAPLFPGAPLPLPIPADLLYLILLFSLFVVPRLLQRYRIPSAVTSFALGAAAGIGAGLFTHDPTVNLLSTLGIVALFLFAGLDVDLDALRGEVQVLLQHVLVRLLALWLVAWAIARLAGLDARVATLVALALLTPSTGFILDSLDGFGLSERERFWVRSKAIATELVALGVLFVTLQSASPAQLGISAAVLIAMILVLPLVFRVFARVVVPHAPRSEFTFLVMLAVACAVITRELGVYYLVGAFVVGMAATRFRERLPAIASERMLHAVEAFASFFVPFYFFHAGLELRREAFTLPALGLGVLLLAVIVPLRLAMTGVHRRLALQEPVRGAMRIGVTMLPTLVFGLVIAGILRDRYDAPPVLTGAVIFYTVASTLIPSLVLRVPPPDFEHPVALPLPTPPGASGAEAEAGAGPAAASPGARAAGAPGAAGGGGPAGVPRA